MTVCEVCCYPAAVYTILPQPGGRGVECCAVCWAQRPADALDLWRIRNNNQVRRAVALPATHHVREEGVE